MFSALAARLDGLRARYADPARAYHGQRHIDLLLGLHAEVRDRLIAPDAVELAIWYHDAVYVPLSPDNEIESAALLRAELAGLADPALIETAAVLVLATRTHAVPPGLSAAVAADCAWFLDMDLSILGAEPGVFDWYDAAIRQEYAIVPEAEWRLRRPRVLATFLARERLYLTEYFHARLDAQARANLRKAIG
jgi:predicted metal-dependent HD superfamily phosphohydrolase